MCTQNWGDWDEMATYYKLPTGKWRAQVRHQGQSTSRVFSLKAQAKSWASEVERKIERGENVSRSGPSRLKTFGHLIDLHIADMHEVAKPLRRSKAYSLDLLDRKLGQKLITSLNRPSLVEYGRSRAREGAGPCTVGAEISYIKTILTHAAAVHGVVVSVEEVDLARVALTRLSIVGKSGERSRRPTEDELEQLFECFDNWKRLTMPMTRIVKFAIATAMRESEITSITWKDLDKRRRTVLVRDRKDPREKDGNHQIVPLTDLSGYDAWDLIEEQRPFAFSDKAPIFPYNSRSVGAAFRRARKKCDIEDLKFHDMRHEATSRFFEAGLTIERVALITGHKDWKMLRRYTHLAPDMVFQRPIGTRGMG